MAERKTSKYELTRGNKVVYVGITDAPAAREAQHRLDKDFDKMRIVGAKATRSGAEQWETDRIHTYMKNHGGDTPEYNKNSSGKEHIVQTSLSSCAGTTILSSLFGACRLRLYGRHFLKSVNPFFRSFVNPRFATLVFSAAKTHSYRTARWLSVVSYSHESLISYFHETILDVLHRELSSPHGEADLCHSKMKY